MNIARTQTFRIKELTDSHLRFPRLSKYNRWVHTYFILLTKKYSRILFSKNTTISLISNTLILRFTRAISMILFLYSMKSLPKFSIKMLPFHRRYFQLLKYSPMRRTSREIIIGIRAKSSRFRNFPGQSATRCSSTRVWRDFVPRSVTGSVLSPRVKPSGTSCATSSRCRLGFRGYIRSEMCNGNMRGENVEAGGEKGLTRITERRGKDKDWWIEGVWESSGTGANKAVNQIWTSYERIDVISELSVLIFAKRKIF